MFFSNSGAQRPGTYEALFKVILVGSSGVGKTSLLESSFTEGNNKPTIGVDFADRILQIKGTKVKLQIWDTAGQERFANIVATYYRGADFAILAYDITDTKSYEKAKSELESVEKHTNGRIHKVVLLGCKLDLEGRRAVSTEEAQRFAEENGLLFIEASAKTGKNKDAIFEMLASEAHQVIKKVKAADKGARPVNPSSGEATNDTSSKCCARS